MQGDGKLKGCLKKGCRHSHLAPQLPRVPEQRASQTFLHPGWLFNHCISRFVRFLTFPFYQSLSIISVACASFINTAFSNLVLYDSKFHGSCQILLICLKFMLYFTLYFCMNLFQHFLSHLLQLFLFFPQCLFLLPKQLLFLLKLLLHLLELLLVLLKCFLVFLKLRLVLLKLLSIFLKFLSVFL